MSFIETALSYFQDFTSVFLEEGETSAEEALSVAVTLSIVAVPLWLITLPKWLIKIWGTYLIMLKKGKFSDDYEDYPDYEWPPQATTTAPSVNGSMNATEMSLGVDGDVTTTMPELATYIPPEAVYNETEFMVRVEPQGVQYILCMGSVISPRHVLTVANCVDERAARVLKSFYSTEYLTLAFDSGPSVDVSIKSAKMPRNYLIRNIRGVPQRVTVALLPLPLLDPAVKPVPMDLKGDFSFPNNVVRIAGWSYATNVPRRVPVRSAVPGPAELAVAELVGDQCKVDEETLMCSGMTANTPFCRAQGVGGMPIMIQIDEKLIIVGIETYGDCQDGIVHGIYLPAHEEFLLQNM